MDLEAQENKLREAVELLIKLRAYLPKSIKFEFEIRRDAIEPYFVTVFDEEREPSQLLETIWLTADDYLTKMPQFRKLEDAMILFSQEGTVDKNGHYRSRNVYFISNFEAFVESFNGSYGWLIFSNEFEGLLEEELSKKV